MPGSGAALTSCSLHPSRMNALASFGAERLFHQHGCACPDRDSSVSVREPSSIADCARTPASTIPAELAATLGAAGRSTVLSPERFVPAWSRSGATWKPARFEPVVHGAIHLGQAVDVLERGLRIHDFERLMLDGARSCSTARGTGSSNPSPRCAGSIRAYAPDAPARAPRACDRALSRCTGKR